MKKLRLQFLILISSIFVYSCTNAPKLDAEVQQITDYLQNNQDYKMPTTVRTVFVLTEQGCMGCNQTFARFMAKHLDKKDCLFLVLSRGKRIDVSMFSKKQENLLHDSLENIDLPLFQNTKALILKDGKVAKKINIDAQGIEAQLKEIEAELKS